MFVPFWKHVQLLTDFLVVQVHVCSVVFAGHCMGMGAQHKQVPVD